MESLAEKPSHPLTRMPAPGALQQENVPATSAKRSPVRIDMTLVAELREMSKDSGDDLLRKAAEIFFSDAPERIAELRATITAHDLARAVQIAHQLKGAAGCVGIISVGELCAEIEANSRKGVADNTEALLRDIEAQLPEARAMLFSGEDPADVS
jgi:HPt (histidine-containing phosphotransfer) domain-containing protein